MHLGHVIGSIWATRKDPSLHGKRMVLLQPLNFDGSLLGGPIAALDTVDAGVGDTVIYVTSAEAAIPFQPKNDITATDATIVGVVDQVQRDRG
jgi:ethanolamine utilization protein EutN